MAGARFTHQVVEVARAGPAAARLTQQPFEAVHDGSPAARFSHQVLEVVRTSADAAPGLSPVALPVTAGPPVPGSPWFTRTLPPYPSGIPTPAALTPEVVTPAQVFARPVTTGPPVPGSPWFFDTLPPYNVPQGNTVLPQPVPTRRGQLPLVNRVPRVMAPANESDAEKFERIAGEQRRLARFTEQLANQINSLVVAGQLVQTGVATWTLRPGAVTMTRNPSVGDDGSTGMSVGTLWVNTATGGVYVNTNNATGAAVWVALNP